MPGGAHPHLGVQVGGSMDKKRSVILLTLFLCGLALSSGVLALHGYDLSWWTVDGGGVTCSSDGYSLGGSIGQPDAGVSVGQVGSVSYTLFGGFWSITAIQQHRLYLPLNMRGL